MDMSNWIAFLSLLLNVALIVFAFIDKIGQKATKSYAAERDFGHLRRNQEQFLELLKLQNDELHESTNAITALTLRIDYWLTNLRGSEQ